MGLKRKRRVRGQLALSLTITIALPLAKGVGHKVNEEPKGPGANKAGKEGMNLGKRKGKVVSQ